MAMLTMAGIPAVTANTITLKRLVAVLHQPIRSGGLQKRSNLF